jgi:uncharacterized protein (TIGR04255 family)
MPIVRFAKPPLIEVVFGVRLELPEFSSVHFGSYWETIRQQFPFQEDRSPIIDEDDEFLLPPFRRVWFLSEDKKRLIQLQGNYFCFNWKHRNTDDYPHFETIFADFIGHWENLGEWWSTISSVPIEPLQYELTYLNQIDQDFGWNSPSDHSKFFTFISQEWNINLPRPLMHDSQLVFSLPDGSTLSVDIDQRSVGDEEVDVIFFKLRVNSLDADKKASDWFEKAHKSIVKTFLNLTQEEIQIKQWGRYEN